MLSLWCKKGLPLRVVGGLLLHGLLFLLPGLLAPRALLAFPVGSHFSISLILSLFIVSAQCERGVFNHSLYCKSPFMKSINAWGVPENFIWFEYAVVY